MLGILICTDTNKLEECGFQCRVGCDDRRFYIWNANGIYDGHVDIVVYEYPDKKTGYFGISKLNKTLILPKIVQLANIGLLKNYEL